MKQSDVVERAMAQIEQRQVTMRPAWHFGLITAVGAIAVTANAFVMVYVVNIASLALRIWIKNRPMYGARSRLAEMTSNFPWWYVVLALVSAGTLVWLLRRTTRLYRLHPALLALAVLGIGFILGIALSFTPFGQSLGGQPGQFRFKQ